MVSKVVSRTLCCGIALMISGCVPTVVLESAQPVSGDRVVIGGTLVLTSQGYWGFPYASYRRGDGATEFSISIQNGVRFGAKQRLAEHVSVSAGLNLSLLPNLSLDAGLLYQAAPNLTLTGRGMYVQQLFGSAEESFWLGGGGVVYRFGPQLYEFSVLATLQGASGPTPTYYLFSWGSGPSQ